ncbi:MAG: efflux RND transporter periplasmic adaptor subunit [Gallionella sp.]|nr:efflux RND transporter periplasmic adaptor subunit [Gallionella sp.]
MKQLFRSWIFWLITCLALSTTIYFGYQKFNTIPLDQQYRLQAVTQGDLSQIVSANGTINPLSLVSVGTQVSGTVKKLYVDFNSKVTQGQILLELDNSMLAAQLKQTQANIQSAVASFELATANEARMRSLFAQEYVSRQELDTAVQAKKVAEAQTQVSNAVLERDRANLAYSVIRSPVAGVVVDRSVDVGQTVAASLQTPTLFKIAQNLSKMQIHANFAEADIGSIRVGMPVKFTVDAFTGKNFKGEVMQIRLNPTTVSNVVTYDVVINVDNPEQLLLPGMTAYVSIAVAERKNVLLAPNAALRFKPTGLDNAKSTDAKNQNGNLPGGGKSGEGAKSKRDGFSGKVYVLRNSELVPISVSLGITDNRNTEIIGGELKVGDELILGEAKMDSKPKASGTPSGPRMF